MPTNTSSPVKRPGLGRRAVSSHAVVTRTNSNSELSLSQSSKAPIHHKPHRPHVVGGGRHHHRNPSIGKNINKLQRFQLAPETTGRHHNRKKSAPPTPIGSPKGQSHVRWDGAVDDNPPKSQAMKRNNSTPILRRNNSGVGKKAIGTDRPLSSAGKKKTVGFELGDDENDDAEWEDTTQSPESTRRNSTVPSSNHSAETTQVLVDPLTFVKRSYPQVTRATSLPDSITNRYLREEADKEEERQEEEDDEGNSDETEQLDQGDIANRLLSPSHSARAPPAMSSISAMAKPTDSASRSASSLNLAGEGARRNFSSTSMGNTTGGGNQTNATSSSMEGGISRFIPSNKSGFNSSSRTDSDPNTPSSFLPHYHPQTPPSPNRGSGKAAASPAPNRGPDLSRTQQKLWLQRTATLNNSPPDSHGVPPVVSPSNIDPTLMAANHARLNAGPYDPNRSLNGGVRVGVPGHDTEARHIRKAYEKSSLELTVVRRFQSPTGDSFNRLRAVARASQALANSQPNSALGKPVKSAPSLPLLQHGRQPSRLGSSSESRSQLPDPHSSASEEHTSHGEISTDTNQGAKSAHPSQRILSSSDEAVHNLPGENEIEDYPQAPVNEAEMMMRRMWESREVASSC